MPKCYILQILMSALLVLITVILMLPVPTLLLVASPVPVTRDTLEMERGAQVSSASNGNMQLIPCTLQILMSVLLMPITVILMLPVPTLLLVASPVPVTWDTLNMRRHLEHVSGEILIYSFSLATYCITGTKIVFDHDGEG